MAENNPVMSRRDKHIDRLRKKYPDKRFEDDDEIFGQISDDYDQFEESQEHEKAFSEMFYKNPKAARLMMEWKDGKDPVASLISIYGKEDILGAIDDPSRLEAIEAANKEFADKVAKSDEFEAQYEKNFPESAKAVDAWAEAQGVSEDMVNTIGAKLAEICGDFILGKFTPETFEMIMKAMNHDMDVANAQEEGEVAGRNAKITENLRRSKKGDGLQTLNGRNGVPGQGGNRAKSIFDLAREAD